MIGRGDEQSIFDYYEPFAVLVLLILTVFIFVKSILYGVISLILVLTVVALYTQAKRRKEYVWSKRIQDVSFYFDRLARKALKEIPIPVCVLELDGRVYWANQAFNCMVFGCNQLDAIKKDVIGKDIVELVGDISFRKVLNEKKVIEERFTYKDKKYNIRYCFTKLDKNTTKEVKKSHIDKLDALQDEREDYRLIMYWMDNTEVEDMKKLYEDSREVVMIIEVDGYEDVLKSTSEENRPLLSIGIQKILSNFEMETHGLMKKLQSGKYILFMRKSAYDEVEKNKFSILEKARNIDCGNSLPVSFSIGVGLDGDSIEETGEFASGAIDMALGRGGDQIAIRNRDGFSFYGGKSKGFERKTKVRSRLIGLALKEIINQSEKILIMGHKYPDMDSMGAAVGVYDMCRFYNKNARVVLDKPNEAVENFVDRLSEEKYFENMFISHERAIDICDKDTLLVIVDTHRPSYTECRELLDISKKVVVIDHHRRSVEFVQDTILLFHEIYVSSSCEMVTELIQYTESDMKIHKLTAEGLLGGIYLDTKNFEFKTGVKTFEAASYLRNMGADTLEVKKFFNSYAEDFLVKAEIIQRTEIIANKICISYSKEEIDNINIVIAKAADELLNIKKIEASFVLGIKGDTVFVSARSLGNINVHILMEKIGGGGHIDIAGAQIKDMSLSQAYNLVKEIIEDFLKEDE